MNRKTVKSPVVRNKVSLLAFKRNLTYSYNHLQCFGLTVTTLCVVVNNSLATWLNLPENSNFRITLSQCWGSSQEAVIPSVRIEVYYKSTNSPYCTIQSSAVPIWYSDTSFATSPGEVVWLMYMYIHIYTYICIYIIYIYI